MEAFATIASYSESAADQLRRAIEELCPRIVTERTELPYRAFLDEVPQSHLDFLRKLVPCYHTADGIFVHAGIDPQAGQVETQDREMLIWGNDDFPALSGRCFGAGHFIHRTVEIVEEP